MDDKERNRQGVQSTQIPSQDRKELRDKAHRLTDRDTPSDDSPQASADNTPDEDKVYRPDANVDNQKSPKSAKHPEHNTSIDKAPHGGAQEEKGKSERRND